jgi:hypothetical protein
VREWINARLTTAAATPSIYEFPPGDPIATALHEYQDARANAAEELLRRVLRDGPDGVSARRKPVELTVAAAAAYHGRPERAHSILESRKPPNCNGFGKKRP